VWPFTKKRPDTGASMSDNDAPDFPAEPTDKGHDHAPERTPEQDRPKTEDDSRAVATDAEADVDKLIAHCESLRRQLADAESAAAARADARVMAALAGASKDAGFLIDALRRISAKARRAIQ
jgi:hypothetical protein